VLYCVHRYFFSRDSAHFSIRFAQLDIRDHEPLPTIISLGDIESKDFDAFLSILYPESVFWSIIYQLTYRGVGISKEITSPMKIGSPCFTSQLVGASLRSAGWHLALSSLRRLTTVSYLHALIQSTIGWFLRYPRCAKEQDLSPCLRLGR